VTTVSAAAQVDANADVGQGHMGDCGTRDPTQQSELEVYLGWNDQGIRNGRERHYGQSMHFFTQALQGLKKVGVLPNSPMPKSAPATTTTTTTAQATALMPVVSDNPSPCTLHVSRTPIQASQDQRQDPIFVSFYDFFKLSVGNGEEDNEEGTIGVDDATPTPTLTQVDDDVLSVCTACIIFNIAAIYQLRASHFPQHSKTRTHAEQRALALYGRVIHCSSHHVSAYLQTLQQHHDSEFPGPALASASSSSLSPSSPSSLASMQDGIAMSETQTTQVMAATEAETSSLSDTLWLLHILATNNRAAVILSKTAAHGAGGEMIRSRSPSPDRVNLEYLNLLLRAYSRYPHHSSGPDVIGTLQVNVLCGFFNWITSSVAPAA